MVVILPAKMHKLRKTHCYYSPRQVLDNGKAVQSVSNSKIEASCADGDNIEGG